MGIDSSELSRIIDEVRTSVLQTNVLQDLLQNIKPRYLGDNGIVRKLAKIISITPKEERKAIGMQLNLLRNEISAIIDDRVHLLKKLSQQRDLENDAIDGSLQALKSERGTVHNITAVIDQIVSIFTRYGFTINSGSEIETDFYNFTALNIPKYHPARQMHDTFYINTLDVSGNSMLLRTHTTTIDIHALTDNGAPLYSIAYGKTFRRDADRTHSPMFHQFEMLAVDRELNMSCLKSYIVQFLKEFFNTNKVNIRIRPSFFPFTEPSAEVDVGYSLKNDKIVIDESCDKFLEIIGCGMIHPNVLRSCNIDSTMYKAIAFGAGIERLAMLKYGIKDARDFCSSDKQWLSFYGFSGSQPIWR